VALVPGVSDLVLSSYWPAAFSEPQPTEGRLGWNASAAAADMVRAQLGPAGSVVTVVPSHTGAAAQTGDVVLILQQTPLNMLGQSYNPGRDFLALGGGLIAIAAVAGAEQSKEKAFQPRFVLWIRNPEANRAIIGENACTVGLTASLVDPATGQAVTEGTQVTGRSVIPDALTARDWASLPKPEQARVLSHCRTALKSAVSQALVRLDVVE